MTKQAQFYLASVTTGTTRVYTVPNANATLAALGPAQTFTAAQTFSAGTNSFGTSTSASTANIATGATTTGNTTALNTGTADLSGSTTNIAIGSARLDAQTAASAASYAYRHARRQRRMTIGRWPEWSTTSARERAKELRREIDAGGDPLGQKETGRDAPRFKDLIDRYTEVHLPHLSALNASDQKSMLAKMVAPDWGNKLVTEITPYDVEKLLNKVAAGRARPSKAKPNNRARKLQGAKPTPVRANRTGEVLRKMFTYAVSWGWREDNPASSFRRRIENPRERFLCHEEIHKLAEALDGAEDRRAADIIRLCMLTGARVGEVRQAQFEHFNLEHLSWSKPASMTKQRKIHRLPISDEAAAIVRQRHLLVPRGCTLLFPSDTPGQPVKEIRRFWMAIQKAVGIPDVRIHDLRHTFASLLVSGGASLEMIGKLLGHSQMQTTQRYAHLMDSPLRAGVDAVASAFRPRPKLVQDADEARKSA